MALAYTKGNKPLDTKYARGGEEITSRSIFMKQQDPFRTSIERQDYKKKTPGGEMSKTIEKAPPK
jgi:hypothetical protein